MGKGSLLLHPHRMIRYIHSGKTSGNVFGSPETGSAFLTSLFL
ncbi:hypothetical protein HMPREF9412_5458 [Paenibacillus sp. HGF5]|nr:hypothetical protein HMPREF9412_5458 [Paenibacillus sp. HGF5]